MPAGSFLWNRRTSLHVWNRFREGKDIENHRIQAALSCFSVKTRYLNQHSNCHSSELSPQRKLHDNNLKVRICVSCQKKINTTRMSVVVNLFWVSIAKYQTLTFMTWSKSISYQNYISISTQNFLILTNLIKPEKNWKYDLMIYRL